MYEIYINESPLIICHTEELSRFEGDQDTYIVKYSGKKHLLQNVNFLESSGAHRRIVVFGDDSKMIFKEFKNLFAIIKASGGVVLNDNKQLLTIFRRGKWDLPKGKRDPGESSKKTALREVREETGATGLSIVSKLSKTYHVYRLGSGKRVLKISKWYLMQAPIQDLIPQSEEDIDEARWLDIGDLEWFRAHTFASIKHLLNKHQEDIRNFVAIFT